MITSCNKPEAPAPTARPPLHFELAGCKRVWRDQQCEIDDEGMLTIWVDGNTPPLVRAGTGVLAPEEARLIAGGHRARYRAPLDATTIVVERDARVSKFTVRPNSESAVLEQAQALRSAGQWAQAEALLQSRNGELTPSESMRARALLARLALARGDVARAVPALKQTAAAALQEGLLSEAAFDTLALAFVLTNKLHDFGQARAVLDRATTDFAGLATVQALLPYYKAVLTVQMGEQQAALLHLKEAILRAERLDMRNDVRAAKKQLAVILHGLGRQQEATALQEGLMAEDDEIRPCQHLGNLITLSWFLLNSDVSIPRDKLTRVFDGVEAALGVCPDPSRRRNHGLNLVYDALHQENWKLARERLDALSLIEGGKDNHLIAWEQLFRGQFDAGRRHWSEALSHYLRSEALAIASGERSLLHAAKLARARVLAERGDTGVALEVLQEVEQLADELVRWVPLGEGQQMFALQLEGGTRSLVHVYLQRGEPKLAAAAARRGRLRLLGAAWRASKIQALRGERRAAWEQAVSDYQSRKAALDRLAARDWELSKAELDAAIRQREVLLQELRNTLGRAHTALDTQDLQTSTTIADASLTRPTLVITRDEREWFALVGVAGEWQAFKLEAVTEKSLPEDWAKALGPAFDRVPGLGSPCAATCTLALIVHPLLEELDVHALTYRESPVLNRVPVVYLLDEWTTVPRRPPIHALTSTLIVGDPSGDLPVARQEAEDVAKRALAPRQTLLVNANASRHTVLANWRDSDLFHFSGHAHFGGLDGLGSGLRLAGNEQLNLADALTAEGSPRFAVLSACDAGRARTENESGLGMSHALVAAGSEVVVAPSRVVADDRAAQFTAALYSTLADYTLDDWARSTRNASLGLQNTDPHSDWSTYRVHAAR